MLQCCHGMPCCKFCDVQTPRGDTLLKTPQKGFCHLFCPTGINWMSELQWLDRPPPAEKQPRAHWQVSFMEIVLDFKAYTGYPLSPVLLSKFVGGEMSLQEKVHMHSSLSL